MKDNQMRTPMSRVRGLGAAHTGTQDFWRQRLTSVAGIPLCIAAIVIVIGLLGRSHAAVVQILGSPIVAIIRGAPAGPRPFARVPAAPTPAPAGRAW